MAGSLGRADDPAGAGNDVDLVVIAVPDVAIATVARAVDPSAAVVMHLAGSRPLTDLAPHRAVASLHPLVSLPDAETAVDREGQGVQPGATSTDRRTEVGEVGPHIRRPDADESTVALVVEAAHLRPDRDRTGIERTGNEPISRPTSASRLRCDRERCAEALER